MEIKLEDNKGVGKVFTLISSTFVRFLTPTFVKGAYLNPGQWKAVYDCTQERPSLRVYKVV